MDSANFIFHLGYIYFPLPRITQWPLLGMQWAPVSQTRLRSFLVPASRESGVRTHKVLATAHRAVPAQPRAHVPCQPLHAGFWSPERDHRLMMAGLGERFTIKSCFMLGVENTGSLAHMFSTRGLSWGTFSGIILNPNEALTSLFSSNCGLSRGWPSDWAIFQYLLSN